MEENSAVKLSASAKEEIINKQKSSGLSQAEFCRREGISVKLFYYWLKMRRDTESKYNRGKLSQAKFIEVNTAAKEQSLSYGASSLDLRLPNGAELKFTW